MKPLSSIFVCEFSGFWSRENSKPFSPSSNSDRCAEFFPLMENTFRKSTFLVCSLFSIAAILAFCAEPKIAPSVVPRITIPMVHLMPIGNINPHHFCNDVVGHENNQLLRIGTNPDFDPSAITVFLDRPSSSRLAAKHAVKSPLRLQINEMADRPFFPRKFSTYWVIREALVEVFQTWKQIDLGVRLCNDARSFRTVLHRFSVLRLGAGTGTNSHPALSFYLINHNFATPTL